MAKKFYPLANQTSGILTQVNQTYEGKDIPQIITTTGSFYKQSGQNIKITNSKNQPKLRKPKM